MKSKPFKASFLGWRILAIFYAAIFLTILILAYTGNLPPFLTQNDKVGHVVLYCIATYLGHRALHYRQVKVLGKSVPLFPLLFGIFTVTEELLQSLSPNRSLDAMDLVASFAGILLGFWFAKRGRQKLD